MLFCSTNYQVNYQSQKRQHDTEVLNVVQNPTKFVVVMVPAHPIEDCFLTVHHSQRQIPTWYYTEDTVT
jgi:hypothetical protein